MKKIVALVGPFASGKDAVKKYLENKYQAKSVKFSQILRDVLSRLSITINRENLINLSTILRQNFGDDLLAKVIAEDAKNLETEIVILDGARRKSDILYAKDIECFALIAIDAELETRYERMKNRNENEGDSQKTFEEFVADHDKETEKTIPELMKEAKFKIDNDGTLEDLYQKIDEIVGSL